MSGRGEVRKRLRGVRRGQVMQGLIGLSKKLATLSRTGSHWRVGSETWYHPACVFPGPLGLLCREGIKGNKALSRETSW